jgi:nucleoside-diphosphate-sugar epimerase
MRIFVAGAAGAIGKRLVPLLLEAGYHVVGTTRSPSTAETLRTAGVEPVVVDAFNAQALARVVAVARPDIVIHQLTDLPPGLAPDQMAEGTRRNARMRSEGTQNLVAAVRAAGIPRLIAQSIAWLYAPGPEPHSEDDPLDLHAADSRAITVGGVETLERLTLTTPGVDGVVLRNGHLYGPNTGSTATPGPPSVHVDAVAHATVLAIEKGHGIYNVADPNDYLSIERAQRELGFDAQFRVKDSS